MLQMHFLFYFYLEVIFSPFQDQSKVQSEDVEEMVERIGNQLLHLELVCLRGSLNLSPIASKCSQLRIRRFFGVA